MTAQRQVIFQTPEGVTFARPLAGPISRMLAVVIDVAVVGVVTQMASSLLSLFGVVSPQLYAALKIVAAFAATMGYPIASEWLWRGQTLGKRLLGLRVIDADGRRVTLPQIIVRNLLRPVDMLPAFYLVGGITAWLQKHHQRLGDLAARTLVIRAEAATEPDVDQLLGGKFNSLLKHQHLTARLRQRVSPAVAGVALETLLRRNELDPAARVRLFAELASYFQRLVPFPPEAIEQLSDEQYVRNAVLVLYRASVEPG